MNRLLLVYILLGLLSGYATAGWNFAAFEGEFPSTTVRACRKHTADAVLWGIATGLVWPVGVPETYFLSNFAEYGWKAPVQRSCSDR